MEDDYRHRFEYLDGYIDWNIRRVKQIHDLKKQGVQTMQNEITIQLHIDYADKEKEQILLDAAKFCARHLYAQAILVNDKVKPKVVVITNDFFSGEKNIPLLDDKVAEGKAALTECGAAEGEDAISDELMKALREEPNGE